MEIDNIFIGNWSSLGVNDGKRRTLRLKHSKSVSVSYFEKVALKNFLAIE
jgi:hypothetical protein